VSATPTAAHSALLGVCFSGCLRIPLPFRGIDLFLWLSPVLYIMVVGMLPTGNAALAIPRCFGINLFLRLSPAVLFVSGTPAIEATRCFVPRGILS
jgi:hypothetical protein